MCDVRAKSRVKKIKPRKIFGKRDGQRCRKDISFIGEWIEEVVCGNIGDYHRVCNSQWDEVAEEEYVPAKERRKTNPKREGKEELNDDGRFARAGSFG